MAGLRGWTDVRGRTTTVALVAALIAAGIGMRATDGWQAKAASLRDSNRVLQARTDRLEQQVENQERDLTINLETIERMGRRDSFHWIGTIREAMRFIDGYVDIPVALPTLPPGVKLHERPIALSEDEVQLYLRRDESFILIFEFGRSQFDGCGGDSAVVVDVNGQRGLLQSKDHYPWATILWPVKPGSQEGRYGITGSLKGSEILELARAMDSAITATSDRPDNGC